MTSRFEEDGRQAVRRNARHRGDHAGRGDRRAHLDLDVVAEYAERMAAGDKIPPLQVMRDDNGVNWLWDGWHRLEAATRNGLESIDCAIRKGDRRAAMLASAGANTTHGLRRSAEVKRRAC